MLVQKKTINKVLKDNYRKALSIQFSLDGFSFCISNVITKEVQNFTVYTFEESLKTPEVLLTKIEELCIENAVLKQNFETITIIHKNSLATLIPSTLFNENELPLYLDYNIKTLTNDFIAFDALTQLDIKNVYVPYVNLNNFFFKLFGEFEYKHHATVLIDKLISYSKNNTEKQCFVNVAKNNFDIVIVENSKLLYYNSFSYSTKEDFIYYILFTAEQMQLNPETVSVLLFGKITTDNPLFKKAYQFIRNCSLLDLQNTAQTLGVSIEEASNHFILFNS